MTDSLFSWLQGSTTPEHSGNPIADALKGGRNTEVAHGEIEEYDDHPVIVQKFYRSEGGGGEWVVKVGVPNGPQERYVTLRYAKQFPAEAVFEKLKRDYDLSEGVPGDAEDE